MLVRDPPKLRQQRPKSHYLFVFFSLLPLSKLLMVEVLNAAGRIDSDGLYTATCRRRDANKFPGRRDDKSLILSSESSSRISLPA